MGIDKLPNESAFDYKERLIVSKIDGDIDIDWSEIALLLNVDCSPDHLRKVGRGIYEAYMNRKNAPPVLPAPDTYERSLQTQRDELYILKKQYSDQRREYLKLLDVDARWQNLTDRLVESARELSSSKPLRFAKDISDTGTNEAVLALNDWHYGMLADNIFNKYDTDICRYRVAKVVNKTIQVCATHNVDRIHILILGDMANGAIHTASRVASEEDTVEQLMHVSEILANAINEIANHVSSTDVYTTFGNHMRTVQNKKDSIHSDNMERIIPWWLKERLGHRNDVSIIQSDYYEFIKLNVLGYNLCAAHGDLDSIRDFGMDINTLFTQLYGESIQYAILADKHHLEEYEKFGIETVLCRSLCGVDEYANNNRLYSKPGQTLMIFSLDQGRECSYNIKV